MTIKPVLMRLFTLMLAVYCGIQVWIGLSLYRGERLYQSGHFEEALHFLDGGAAWDRWNPDLSLFQGLSRWMLWKKGRKPENLRVAHEEFQKASQLVPSWGKAWFYRALSEKALVAFNPSVAPAEKAAAAALFEKARLLEPGSPWMMVQTALETLDGSVPLSKKEYRVLIRRLRRALAKHYADQASPYLLPVYTRLFALGLRAEVFTVTPREAASYEQLVRFLRDRQQWQDYTDSYSKLISYRQERYQNMCGQADTLLLAGKTMKADALYRAAIPYYPEAYRAKAGLLLSVNPPETAWLEDVLLRDEEELGFYWERLQAVADGTNNPYIQGLLAFRLANYSRAVEELGKNRIPDPKARRRFLAQSHIEMGQMNAAEKLLLPVLDEKSPDLRELLLLEPFLENGSPSMRHRYSEKIEAVTSRKISADQWSVQRSPESSPLAPPRLVGIPVNLKSGRVHIRILLKRHSAERNAVLIRLRLWDDRREQLIGAAAVESSVWKPFTWDAETTGGWRWLQLEVENGAGQEIGKWPALDTGPVHLEYPE